MFLTAHFLVFENFDPCLSYARPTNFQKWEVVVDKGSHL